jgi:thioredoxin-dependent peroxiredoxin
MTQCIPVTLNSKESTEMINNYQTTVVTDASKGGNIMRIQEREPAKGFHVEDIWGNSINLADYAGKYVLLSFFRFASCPYCNLRVHRMIVRHQAYREQGLEMLAVFESPRKTMLRYVGGRQQASFPIIGDPKNELYRLYGLETSWRKLVKTFLTPSSFLKTVGEGFYATFVKGFWPGKIDASIHRMPADFLIGPDKVIMKAYYGNYPGDHLPFEEIEQLLKSTSSQNDLPHRDNALRLQTEASSVS